MPKTASRWRRALCAAPACGRVLQLDIQDNNRVIIMDDEYYNLESIKPLSINDAHFLVYSKAYHYPGIIRIFKPTRPYEKLYDGLESDIDKKPSPSNSISIETDTERSIRRTRRTIKDYVLCNDFSLFVTWTFKGKHRTDIQYCKKVLHNWIKNEIARKGAFGYLIIMELHKDGSPHFHGLLMGYPGEIILGINPKTGKPARPNGRYQYSLKSFTSGFTNVQKIDQKRDSLSKVGFYIQKYIKKDMPLFFNKNRYYASHKLKKPIIEYNPEPWYENETPDFTHTNEYGTILDFDIRNHPLASLFHKDTP